MYENNWTSLSKRSQSRVSNQAVLSYGSVYYAIQSGSDRPSDRM